MTSVTLKSKVKVTPSAHNSVHMVLKQDDIDKLVRLGFVIAKILTKYQQYTVCYLGGWAKVTNLCEHLSLASSYSEPVCQIYDSIFSMCTFQYVYLSRY